MAPHGTVVSTVTMNGSNMQSESSNGVMAVETTPLISAVPAAASPKVIKNDGEHDYCYSSSSPSSPGGIAVGGGLWSRLIFDWFTPLLERGNAKKRLDQEDLDLIPLPPDCQTDPVAAAFELYWNKELQQHKQTQQLHKQQQHHHHIQPSLMRALFRAFGGDFVRAGFLKLVHDLCVFVGPQVLHAMIVFLRSSTENGTTAKSSSMMRGFSLMLAVTLSQTLMSFCLRHYFFKCYTTGLRVRTAVVVAIYRKALHVSAGERNTRTVGEITNLMSIDAQRLQELMNYLHALWYSPLQISLALFFLWQQLGPSSLGGVLVICFMIPITKMVASWMGGMQKRLMKAKDARVNLNSEILSNMKIIKLQSWEESFKERILHLRSVELQTLFDYLIGRSLSSIFWTFTPLLVALATFAAYVWSGHQLDVASSLTALALFEILRFPLFMLPQIINNCIEAMVAVNRVQSFLLCEEHKSIGPGTLQENGISMTNVSAAYDSKKIQLFSSMTEPNHEKSKELVELQWQASLLQSQLEAAEREIRQLAAAHGSGTSSAAIDDFTTMESSAHSISDNGGVGNLLCLKRINFVCRPGELVAVVGGVGCGKSSLLNAILGEVRLLNGQMQVKGRLAYFSQSPFIMNATVRDNIIFGRGYDDDNNNSNGNQKQEQQAVVDEDLYQRALTSCALKHDLELLPDGDLTEIGEKGITLSGGQKARVALARAVYHAAAITLIDDALSAVDAHVAKTLFEEAITNELLKTRNGDNDKRSVILVTNALQFLNHPRVDRIVVVQDGYIIEQGSYAELLSKKDSAFARFLSVLNETGVSGSLVEGCKNESEDGVLVMDTKNGSPTVVRRRRLSEKSITDEESSVEKKKPTKLMTEEARMTGHVQLGVYASWIRSMGGLLAPICILLSYGITAFFSISANWWLTFWSSHANERSQAYFLLIYALINLSIAIAGLLRIVVMVFVGLRSARVLFANLLSVVLEAPMSFYDTTPTGRIVNRFSKDVYAVDEKLMETLNSYLNNLFQVLSTLAVIAGVTPAFLIIVVPMILYYMSQQAYFTITYRELKRIDSVNRSPLYALLGESVDGVAVIRAFEAQHFLTSRLNEMLDLQQHAYYLTCAAQSWLAVRLELIGTLIITFACFIAVVQHAMNGANETFAGLAGLGISYALSVTQSLNWSVRMASDMEASMVAVERIEEYSQIKSEAPRKTPVDQTLRDPWPVRGEVVFKNAKLRYRSGLPLVLKGLEIKIPGGSKVGVVGRTGAGKSTLMVALLRIVELSEGSILIDGQDISQVGLAKLRESIAVIPQDPVLFSGTVRSNLDPFDEYPDDTVFSTLERVGLIVKYTSSNSLTSMGQGCVRSLSDLVIEGGLNFSVGQRQLLVIARALLRGARIVIMDEATAAVDAETDSMIQKVVRTEFAAATCLTVAHRLNTIMDSDFVLVVSDGKAQEFDTPAALLRKGGMFRDLVEAADQLDY